MQNNDLKSPYLVGDILFNELFPGGRAVVYYLFFVFLIKNRLPIKRPPVLRNINKINNLEI